MRKPLILCSALLVACGQHDTASYTEVAGAPKSAETLALEAGARLLQGQAPLNAVSAYLNGFHFYNGDMDGQMEAHHYVTRLNEDVMQALIYDGNGGDAKLMGVEYIISERLFRTLPAEEKTLWHSHDYEVKSGTLVAPGLPRVAERQLMEQVVSTYGKTWHTWHTDRDKTLPYGIPALMMGFTADGQLDPALQQARDARVDVDTDAIRRSRESIAQPEVDPLANAWEKGDVIQLQRVRGAGEHRQGGSSGAAEVHESGRLREQLRRSGEH
ncbi:OBAP family protein [Pseudomonas lopnurensis]|uniref:OBAP family protein n=1 Tax=Pseudomonas lopnurensis TaxID=1477517 RepID=UPI00187911FF|nr:OBAP family protein [Pseudomonas lopnurensis]MBE7375419.1 OBAP family protein [Pseudomonas lopnurensis]